MFYVTGHREEPTYSELISYRFENVIQNPANVVITNLFHKRLKFKLFTRQIVN